MAVTAEETASRLSAVARRVAEQLCRDDMAVGPAAPSRNAFSVFDSVSAADRAEVIGLAEQVPGASRAMGSMVGMAVADAVGHMFEFLPVCKPGSHWDPETLEFVGVFNKFRLKPGQWTDDTSMGLCMADSLLVHGGYNGSDMRVRFWNWWNCGYNNAFRHDNSRDGSVGLGGNISQSLFDVRNARPPPRYEAEGEDAGNGSLMRLAPVPLYFHAEEDLAVRMSAESSYTTHPGPIAAEACAFLAFVIVRALARPPELRETAAQFLDACVEAFLAKVEPGAMLALAKLLRSAEPAGSTERCWNWRDPAGPFLGETLAARGGLYNGYPVSAGYFGAYSMDGLAIALHSVYHTTSFMGAIARCVNFLGDADSTGAICGQIAGAFYGLGAIDVRLVDKLRRWDGGEIALRGALLHALGAELPEVVRTQARGSASRALSGLGGGCAAGKEREVTKRAKIDAQPMLLEMAPPSADGVDEEVRAAARAAGLEDELGGFAVYPRTSCPHLEGKAVVVPESISMDARCATCGEDEVWICGICGELLCSRYKNAHMVQHVEEEGHLLGLSLSDLSVWCFGCDAYLDIYAIPALQPLYAAAHLAKFGERPPLPATPGAQASSSASA